MKYALSILLFFLLGKQECFLFQEKLIFDKEVTVIRILDGDTFVGVTTKGEHLKMRIHAIDAPEKGQPFSQKAKQQLYDYIYQKKIYVRTINIDRYKRFIVKVFTKDGKDVGLQMISSGLAWHYVKYDNSTVYAIAEKKSRKHRLGIWQDSNPIAPWQWRKNKKSRYF